MKNVKLVIEYNGSDFHGWQKQEGQRTVQQELESAFFELLKENVSVEGSGRTDSGVHALGQVASVKFENSIPIKNLPTALNDLLPPDILIKSAKQVPEEFHARFSAKKKTYRYVVSTVKSAIDCKSVGVFEFDVDLEKMQNASKLLLGKHNFRAFCSSQTNVKNFEREIYDISIKKQGKRFVFLVSGNGFLYNMVRIIVGTLLEVGRGKLSEKDIQNALSTGKRSFCGKTMAPQGLTLVKVEYER